MKQSKQYLSVLGYLFSAIFAPMTQAEQYCNTVFSGLVKTAAEEYIKNNKDTACAGLKQGPIGIDKTKKLELGDFRLCENGHIITAAIDVAIECTTSDKALFPLEVADKLHAEVTADLDHCVVSSTKVSGDTEPVKALIALTNTNQKFKEASEIEIQKYCKKSQ